jgi:hypothetical protein
MNQDRQGRLPPGIGWNAWVKRYQGDYVVHDNAAIHRAR